MKKTIFVTMILVITILLISPAWAVKKGKIDQNAIEALSPLGQRIKNYYGLEEQINIAEKEKIVLENKIESAKKAFTAWWNKRQEKIDLIRNNPIFFENDSYTLSPKAKVSIAVNATLIKEIFKMTDEPEKANPIIRTFTDGVGTEGHNITLSQNRSNAVMEEYEKHGLPNWLFSVESYGEYRRKNSLAQTTNPKQRRADTIIEISNERPTPPEYQILALKLDLINARIDNLKRDAQFAEHNIEFPWKGYAKRRGVEKIHGDSGHKHY